MTEQPNKTTIAEILDKYIPEIKKTSVEAEQAATSLFNNMFQAELRAIDEREATRKRNTRIVGVINSSLLPDKRTK